MSHLRLLLILLVAAATPISAAQASSTQRHGVGTVKRRAPRAHASIINGTVAPGPGPLALIANAQGGCTGSVLSVNVVLTAGHCVRDNSAGLLVDPDSYFVQTGAVTAGAGPGVVSHVNRVVLYPNYNPSTGYADLALLQLSTQTTAPVMPLAGSSDLGLLTAGTGAAAEGWGVYIPGSDESSMDLRAGSQVVQSPAYCALHAQQMGVPFNSSVTFCAIDPQGVYGACHGDSGGPLVAQRPAGSIAQIGITSWGDPNCSTSQPGYFTRVDAFSAWISSWVTALAPPPPPPPLAPLAPAPTPAAPTPPTPIPAPTAPAVAAPAPSTITARYSAHTTHHGYLSAAVRGDGLHLVWIRISLQLSCRHGYRTYVNDTFTAPTAAAWAMSANAPLRLSLGRPASRRWFRQTDTLAVAPGPGGLNGSVKVTLRARAGKIGVCTATLPSFHLTH